MTALLLLLLAGPCGPHYRWAAKTDTMLASLAPRPTSVQEMLTLWAVPATDAEAAYYCAPRSGRETAVYALAGYVRRLRHEADGDLHVELTAGPTSEVGRCVVVEVPPAALSRRFASARAVLAKLGVGAHVRVTGAAFYDGEHRAPGHARAHGRCNSSLRALWEIHPVYSVEEAR